MKHDGQKNREFRLDENSSFFIYHSSLKIYHYGRK